MTDFFMRAIPLPIPRPVMEEVHPVLDLPPLKFDIPIPEMADIDLTYPLLGLDWVMYPWTYTKGFFMEHSNLFEFSERLTTIGEWGLTYALIAACFLVIAIPVAYVVKLGIEKIWK